MLVVLVLESLGDAEVDEEELVLVGVAADEDVFGLEVAVDNAPK